MARCTVAFMPPRLMSGGTQRHLLEVLKFLDRERFAPLVVVAKDGGELGAAIGASGVAVARLSLGERVLSLDFARCVRETAALFRRHAVDVVQCFQWRPALIGIAAARLARRGRIVAGRRSVPVERGVRGLLDELAMRCADRIVVNAESLRPRGRAGLRTEVIPSGVDTDHFRPEPGARSAAKARLGVPASGALIGTVGRLERRKGTDSLIEAAGRLGARGLDGWRLAIVGDGPMRDELVALGARLGVADRLLLLGERTDVRDCLAAFDLFVLPSRTEGMSNALLEAMAMELPVVATAVGGNSEVITADTTGVLVPPDDPAALAAAIEVVATTPGLGERLGAAARRRVEERFGARAMVRRLETVYASVLPDARLATRVRSAAAA